jgi:hypothetical protein
VLGPTDDNRIEPDISTNHKLPLLQQPTQQVIKGMELFLNINGCAWCDRNLLLLRKEHFNSLSKKNFMLSATLRGIMIHSADEAGEAWS